MQNNTDFPHAPPRTMRPEERINRGKNPTRSPSPPHSRPLKDTKRPSTYGPSKLRQQVIFLAHPDSVDGKVLQGLSQESTLGERTVSSRGRERSHSAERAMNQSTSKASKPNRIALLKLRFTREPPVEDAAALPNASPTLPRRVRLLHRAAGHNGSQTSRRRENEAIHQTALTLFNMRTVKPPVQRQTLRPDVLGNEIRLMEEMNKIVTAAQTLMSMRYLEPPQGPGAWKNGGFRLLPHENEGGDASGHSLVITGDELEISDDDSKASLLDVQGDCDMFRSNRAVW